MNLQKTLIYAFISLIIISLNASAEVVLDQSAACNQSVNKGDYPLAVNQADALLKMNVNNNEALLCKGRALGAQGKYSEALSVLMLAEKQSTDNFNSVISNMLIGNLHKANQKYAEAIASYEKSIGFAKTSTNEKLERANHNLIGAVHSQNKDYNASLASYLVGSKLAMNDNERAESFSLLAANYKTLGQHDLAIENQVKAVQMQKKAGTLDEFADATLMLGQVYIGAKEYANADKTLTKFAQFAKENGGAYYEAKARLYLAESMAGSGDSASAKTSFTDARSIAKSVGDNDLNSEIEATAKKLGY